MKRKIGTLVEDELYQSVKLLAVQQRIPITEIMHHALNDYVQRYNIRGPEKINLSRLFEPDPIELSPDQFQTSLEADLFDR